jgi:protease-4
MFRDLTEDERKYFQRLIDDLHYQFVNVVSIERNIPFSKAKKLANGEVYSGNQALKNGLIDMLGTLEDAVLLASSKTGMEGRPIIVYPPEKKKGLLNTLFGDILSPASLSNLNLYPQIEYRIK